MKTLDKSNQEDIKYKQRTANIALAMSKTLEWFTVDMIIQSGKILSKSKLNRMFRLGYQLAFEQTPNSLNPAISHSSKILTDTKSYRGRENLLAVIFLFWTV